MKWYAKIWRIFSGKLKMKFSLVDFDDVNWDLDMENIHTIIFGEISIYVVFKDGGYKLFPSTLPNKNNLPDIKLAQEKKPT